MDKITGSFFKMALLFACLFSQSLNAQQQQERQKMVRQHDRLLQEAGADLADDDFIGAEVDLRKAISILPGEETGKYNLGTAYYNKALNQEAMRRFSQSAEVAEGKETKHKAFHNLGNTYMNAKDYEKAVEAYKNALRNNPQDDETRYNLALAKDLLKKNPPQGGDDENKDDQNKQDQDKDQQENRDNKENEQDKQDQQQDQQDQGDDQQDKDQGDQQDDNKDGDNNDQRDKKPREGDQEDQKKQPAPGQLSPQQIQNLLEAMNNEEKKVQDKINARKRKGAKVKSNKDW